MKLSIAMATCNGAAHVGEQLASLAQQSRRPDELVVVDDASTDETAEIVHAFAATAPFPVRLEINTRRLGTVGNFDRALRLCTGDLVMLCDQDDVWLPAKIEALVQYAKHHPGMGCMINDAWLTDELLQPIGASKMERIEAAGLPETTMVQGCCTTFRRELLDVLLPIPPDQPAHDNWLVQMSDLLGQTLRLREPLQYYRRHGKNVSNATVNRLDRPGLRQRVLESLEDLLRRVRTGEGLDRELRFLLAAVKRMEDRSAELVAAVGGELAHKARSTSVTQLGVLRRRAYIRGMARMRRLPHVCRLWSAGGYRASGKMIGAIKDLLSKGKVEAHIE